MLLPNKSGLWLDAVIKLLSNPELGDEPKAVWEKMESSDAALNRVQNGSSERIFKDLKENVVEMQGPNCSSESERGLPSSFIYHID